MEKWIYKKKSPVPTSRKRNVIDILIQFVPIFIEKRKIDSEDNKMQ